MTLSLIRISYIKLDDLKKKYWINFEGIGNISLNETLLNNKYAGKVCKKNGSTITCRDYCNNRKNDKDSLKMQMKWAPNKSWGDLFDITR